jgi:ABC-type multidrug transport system fused ATPase/permease subunit
MSLPLRQYYALLREYLRPYLGMVALLGALIAGLSLLELVIPQVIGRFIQGTQSDAVAASLIRDGLLVLGLVVLKILTSVGSSYFSQKLGWKATNDLRSRLIQHALHLDMEFHNAHTPGEMIERIDGDVTLLADFFSFFNLQVVCNFLIMFGILAYTFWERWWIGLVLFGAVILAGLVIIRVSRIAVLPYRRFREATSDFSSFLAEYLGGRLAIRASNARSFLMRSLWQVMQDFRTAIVNTFVAGETVTHLPPAVNNVLQVLILGFCAYLYLSGSMELGVVYVLYAYSGMIVSRLGRMGNQVSWMQSASANITRIQTLLATESRVVDRGAARPETYEQRTDKRQGIGIRFEEVSFGYENSAKPIRRATDGSQVIRGKENVLKGVSFEVSPGKVLGLLGRTGSGKTTLTRLLFRLYDPNEGSICLYEENNPTRIDLRDLPLAALRRQIGLVTQEVQFFRANLRDNLTFFKADVPDAEIRQVIEDLGLGGWLRSLPAGLDTVLEGGAGLSAGQAQLLACSRIFLYHPDVFILDEATSRLDPLTERLLKRVVERLAGTCTMIIVAHRLETVERADDILILESGRILEKGPRAELANDPASIFSGLLQKGLADLLA